MLDFHVAGLLTAAVAGVIVRLASSDWGYAIAAFAAVLALSLLVGVARRASTRYVVTDRRLYIKRGILGRTEQHTTIDRVQNVETRQSLWERVLRLGTVDFDTAGTDDSQFAFEGIASPKLVVAAVDRAQELASRTESTARV